MAIALQSSDRSDALTEALTGIGFEVVTVDDILDVADAVDPDEPFVAVVGGSEPGWLRKVSDLIRIRPTARILSLVEIETPEALLTALAAGVTGFVPPTADVDAVVRSVRSMVDGDVSIPRRMVSALVAEVRHGRGHTVRTAAGPIDVTDREWQILQLLVQRRSTREMADALYVSVGTVRSHVSTLLKKIGAVDREDAIRLIQRGHR